MDKNFQLAEISAKAAALFRDARETLESSKDSRLRELGAKTPQQLLENKDALSIVFAGQYSAGKSTVLKILTGKDIRTGQGVTTDSVTRYDWNGINVIDTPGIHTQRHPDHDAMTYEAISKADLIVFVLTNEGFGAHLGAHFRKLAYELNKGREMMLVVNKMDNDALGNEESVRKTKTADIDLVLAPDYSARDMLVSFISADAKERLREAEDEEEREYYRQLSGWDGFIDNLNEFGNRKGFSGRCTTALFKLERVLEEALSGFTSDSKEADASREVLERNRRAIKECKDSVLKKARLAMGKIASTILDIGNTLAMNLDSSSKQELFEKEVEKAVTRTDEIAARASEELAAIIGEETEKLEAKLESIFSSTLTQALLEHLKRLLGGVKIDPDTMQNMQKAARISKNFGSWLQKMSASPNPGSVWNRFFKLGSYSGSSTHKAVLKVGKFVGYKFKPWEALKISSKIGQFGKFLGVAGSIAGVAFQIWNDSQEAEAEKSLMEARGSIRETFRDASREIEMSYDEQTKSWVAEELDTQLEDIDSALNDLDNARRVEKAEFCKIKILLDRTRSLIREIQQSF